MARLNRRLRKPTAIASVNSLPSLGIAELSVGGNSSTRLLR